MNWPTWGGQGERAGRGWGGGGRWRKRVGGGGGGEKAPLSLSVSPSLSLSRPSLPPTSPLSHTHTHLQVKAAQGDRHVVQLLPRPLVVGRPQLVLEAVRRPARDPPQQRGLRLAGLVRPVHAARPPPKGQGPGTAGQAAGAKGGVILGLGGQGNSVLGLSHSCGAAGGGWGGKAGGEDQGTRAGRGNGAGDRHADVSGRVEQRQPPPQGVWGVRARVAPDVGMKNKTKNERARRELIAWRPHYVVFSPTPRLSPTHHAPPPHPTPLPPPAWRPAPSSSHGDEDGVSGAG